MSRWAWVVSKENRGTILRWIERAPAGFRVELKETKRSLPQNDRFWASLTDIANQVEWRDLLGRPRRLTTEQWKRFFLDMLNSEAVNVPNADGTGVVNVGGSSDLSKAEMSDLLELIYAFGAERGVVFHDTQAVAA